MKHIIQMYYEQRVIKYDTPLQPYAALPGRAMKIWKTKRAKTCTLLLRRHFSGS